MKRKEKVAGHKESAPPIFTDFGFLQYLGRSREKGKKQWVNGGNSGLVRKKEKEEKVNGEIIDSATKRKREKRLT